MSEFARTNWVCRDCGADTTVFHEPRVRFDPVTSLYFETGICDTCADLYHTDEDEIFSGDTCNE